MKSSQNSRRVNSENQAQTEKSSVKPYSIDVLDLGEIEAQFGLMLRDKANHDNYVLLKFENLDRISQYYEEFKKEFSMNRHLLSLTVVAIISSGCATLSQDDAFQPIKQLKVDLSDNNIIWSRNAEDEQKIKLAVDKGIADDDPNVLERYVGDYVFNPKAGTGAVRIDQPIEVSEVGTGFMMTKRSTFTKFKEAYPQYSYKPDHIRTEHFDGSRKIMQYFQAEIDPKSERYLSEDYWFCQKAQAIELKTWFCPWMKLQHVGTYIFGGSLADLASIGVAATADPKALKKEDK